MPAPIEVPAPEGWSDFRRGTHASSATAELYVVSKGRDAKINASVFDWLALRDVVTEEKALEALDTIQFRETNDPDFLFWHKVETAALLPASRAGNKFRVRLGALTDLKSGSTVLRDRGVTSWLSHFASGRLFSHLAESMQRSGGASAARDAMAYADKADEYYSGLEGAEHLKAMTDIIRGRLHAWRNDVQGATASLSMALAQFRMDGNTIREAEASYELAIANLDINRPDVAEKLFSIAINAGDGQPSRRDAMARSLQSRARARTLLAADSTFDLESRMSFLELATADASKAYTLSRSAEAIEELDALCFELDASLEAEARDVHGFRPAMAARDLAAIELLRADLEDESQAAIARSRLWLRVACKEAGYSDIFSPGASGSLREKISAGGTSDFTALRLAQTEFQILSHSTPDRAAILLIELGKRFSDREEIHFAIECFELAARALSEAGTERPSLRRDAAYWHFRARKLATSIGYRLTEWSEINVSISQREAAAEMMEQLLSLTRRFGVEVSQLVRFSPSQLSAEVISYSRRSSQFLHLCRTDIAGGIDGEMLRGLADRGDIPWIVSFGEAGSGWEFVLEEQERGRPLGDIITEPRLTGETAILVARLFRAVAALSIAHSAGGRPSAPLFITPDNILLQAGGRCLITAFGQSRGVFQPSPAWAFLYRGTGVDSASKAKADIVAMARLALLLFNGGRVDFSMMFQRTFAKKVFGIRKLALDGIDTKDVEMLSGLLRGRRVRRSADASDRKTPGNAPAGPLDLLAFAEAMDKYS